MRYFDAFLAYRDGLGGGSTTVEGQPMIRSRIRHLRRRLLEIEYEMDRETDPMLYAQLERERENITFVLGHEGDLLNLANHLQWRNTDHVSAYLCALPLGEAQTAGQAHLNLLVWEAVHAANHYEQIRRFLQAQRQRCRKQFDGLVELIQHLLDHLLRPWLPNPSWVKAADNDLRLLA